MKMAAGVLIFAVCLFSACRDEHDVIVAGSTSVQPYAEVLAEEYMIQHPQNAVDIQGGGSSAGITAAETGTADIGMSSRALDDTEQYLWSVEIAKDGLAMIVNPKNPIQNLSLAQIRGIYTTDIKKWSELGGTDTKIHIISREEGSGTRTSFEELIMGNSRITPKAIIQDSNGAVRQLVSDDPDSIGFLSLGLVDHTVKALDLDGIAATRENILNGSYGLLRSFLFVSKHQPVDIAMDYINFVLSPEGQRILSNEGLIPE
ncbi:MAG: phosphate ABC transporter substrate-binding protein [Treponema sp.]|nr:phosphate ABC transporter substrate-binding protein [Treponema sp.]